MSDPMISTEELAARLGEAGVRLVDASWHLVERDARKDYLEGHLPGAVFFDIDAIADTDTDLPHMLPTPAAFADAVGALGISDRDTIVVYDSVGMFSAARVWWTFRAMGATDVRVLDGGLPKWLAEGRPVERGETIPAPASFVPRFRRGLVRDLAALKHELDGREVQVVDARPADRFTGAAPELRPHLRSGHMPGARNVPLARIIDQGRLRPADELRAIFAAAGVDPATPVTATCGSGITAAGLVLALARLGNDDAAVYDGSWAEYGARKDTPVVTGGSA